jgi:NADPH:quinone reductase-like Zn-dependent oxidoreductase
MLTMRVYVLPTGCRSTEELRINERPAPVPGPSQVLVRMRAASLNSRDQAVANGTYVGGALGRDTVPLSDGAGEVTAIGPGVTRFKPGDRVAATFFQRPPGGPLLASPGPLGSPLDGVLAEQAVFNEDGLVAIPSALSFEEAACLPCAGVTAWHGLFRAGTPVRAGSTVLVLGTGGVSILALQLAKAAGARVIVTSSSDGKIERAKALGASDGVNYTYHDEWDKEVMKATGGRGVDCVIEVGGVGTLNRSIHSLAPGGKIALIGLLTGRNGTVSPYGLMPKGGSLHGVFVGDREMFEEMNRAIDVARITPVVDRVFPFDDAVEAYRHHASGQFFGKIVIRLA